jgi:hypothetical protein
VTKRSIAQKPPDGRRRRFELIVNLALGLAVPLSRLGRADKLIE